MQSGLVSGMAWWMVELTYHFTVTIRGDVSGRMGAPSSVEAIIPQIPGTGRPGPADTFPGLERSSIQGN